MLLLSRSIFLCSAGLLLTSSAVAQLAPEIGYLHPAGAQAGTSVEITIGGYDWTPDMQLVPHDPRVKLELIGPPSPVLVPEAPYWFGAKARGYAWPLPREFQARLTVPADVPPGFVKWQAANANGVSPVGVIHIGDHPEVLEEREATGPQVLPAIPVTVSGQIRRIEEIDRYRFRAEQTGPVTIELLARQLTSPTNPMCLHGMLQVIDDVGQRIIDASAAEGQDAVVTFAVEAGRDYLIQLHDLDFAGDRSYVYRLTVTPGPGLLAAYPAAGRRGETRTVEFVGWGMATGKPLLESVTREITFPSDPRLTAFTYTLETPFGKTRPYGFELSDMPELLEGTAITQLPIAVTGAMEERFGSKTYPVALKKGDVWRIAAQSRTIGQPLDLDLRVIGPSGKELATADDSPPSMDPELDFTVPEDGQYQFIVSDHSGHSGHRGAAYRLSIEQPREDLTLNIPDLLSVAIGSKAVLAVKTPPGKSHQQIDLQIDGLPPGLTVPPNLTIPPDKNELAIEVAAAADAPAAARLATITATTLVNGNLVTQPVKSLVVAGIMKPRIKITPEGLDDVSKVHRGSTHRFPLLIDRLEGFDGPITLEMTAKQQRHRQGLAGDELVVPAGVARFDYPIFVPEWLETTKTSRMILNGAVQVPDPQGTLRTLLQRMELRLGILPMGALMKLAHAPEEYHVTLGGSVSIPLVVTKSPEFRESVRIEFVPDGSQMDLMTAEAIHLSPDETRSAFTIRFRDDARLCGEQKLHIRATALQQGKWLVKSETTVNVDVKAK